MDRLMMAVVLVAVMAGAALADDIIAQPQVREVSLFKNGLGWFMMQGQLSGAGPLTITDVPVAVHGSLWLGYNPGQMTLQSLTARRSEVERSRPAISIPDMLRANIGKTVEIFFAETSRRGVITAIPENEQPVVTPQYQFQSRIIPSTGEIMLFTADGRTEAIRLGDINRVAGDATLATELKYQEERPVLEVRFAAPRATDYSLSYLARGVAWAPAYRIDISDPAKAGFRLQGTFINEAQDLSDVTVNFISGFPNLTQNNVTSPLSNVESLEAFLNALGGSGGYQRREGRMMVQSAMFANAPGYYGGDEAVLPVAGDGDYAGDLFYYRVPHVTLKKNERAAYDLLADRVPYSHIYTWQIAPGGAQNGRYQRSEGGAENETVWHEIKFTNTFSQPLTTGPAIVVEGGRVLGQDVLNYCAAGGEGRVKITKALDIRAEQVETEQARQHDARNFNGSTYSKVTVAGVLNLRNFKREAVTVEISRTVTGEFISSSTTCAAVKQAEAVRAVNPTTELKWTVTVPAGGVLEIKYSYFVFVN